MLSGKVFEYLGAGRPVVALVPPNGAAARLLRDTGAGIIVASDDVEGAAAALRELRDRWAAGDDLEVVLSDEQRALLSRATRAGDLGELLRSLVESRAY
jgi:sirohydrochlorin ferrochelatase